MPTTLPSPTLPALGFWAALAAAEAIESVSGFRAALKWPNDLTGGGGKVAGILVEGETIGASSRMIVGIGINVNRPSVVPPELAGRAAWLSDLVGRSIDRTGLAAALLHAYERSYDRLLGSPREIIAEWARLARLEGRRLIVHSAGGALLHEGTARAVAEDGALVLETAEGVVRVTLGDVAML